MVDSLQYINNKTKDNSFVDRSTVLSRQIHYLCTGIVSPVAVSASLSRAIIHGLRTS